MEPTESWWRRKKGQKSWSCHTRLVLNGETELLANGQGVEFAQIMPFVKQWKKEGVFQEHVKLHGIEYMMTCYSFKLGESEDFLQMVSMMSYKDILQ